MDSHRLYFDPSASHGNMLFLGTGNPGFRGKTLMMSMEDSPKGRPLFFTSSSEELYEDEYYDEQLPEKKRRLTPEQVVMLEQSFEAENKLEPERKSELAKKLGLQPRQVAVWFQNRRARWKTKQLEKDFDVLKSSYDALVASYDSISNENNKLKSQVLSLTEKLQATERNRPQAQSSGPGLQLADPIPTDPAQILAQQTSAKAEDLVSSGSTRGSAVANEDNNPQLVESGESYFPSDEDHPPCVGPIDAVQSEEDDGSFDGRSCYLSDMLTVVNQHPNQVGWSWVWS